MGSCVALHQGSTLSDSYLKYLSVCFYFKIKGLRFFPSSNYSTGGGINKPKIHAVSDVTALIQFQRQSHTLKTIGGYMTLGSVMLLIILKTIFSP